jgi:hypothetical protein
MAWSDPLQFVATSVVERCRPSAMRARIRSRRVDSLSVRGDASDLVGDVVPRADASLTAQAR